MVFTSQGKYLIVTWLAVIVAGIFDTCFAIAPKPIVLEPIVPGPIMPEPIVLRHSRGRATVRLTT